MAVQFGTPFRMYPGAVSVSKEHLSQDYRVAPFLREEGLGNHWLGPTAGLDCLQLRKFCAWNRFTVSFCLRSRSINNTLLLLLLLLLLTAIELSLCGISPYTSTDKTNKNKYT